MSGSDEAFTFVSGSDMGLTDEDAQQVVGLSVPKTGERATTLRVQAAELFGAVVALPATIAIVVFLDSESSADVSVRRMVKKFIKLGVHALIRHVAATEAVKRIRGDVVTESLDRSRLSPLRTPEIVDRKVLERALTGVDGDAMVNPTELVASDGGIVVVIDQ